jgi:hypothetical protein
MNPFTVIARPVAFGCRQAGRALQLTADLLEQVTDRDETQQERRQPPPSPAQPEAPPPSSAPAPKPLDDVSITRKVETDLFRDPDVPKGSIDVNTADGVVWTRRSKPSQLRRRVTTQTSGEKDAPATAEPTPKEVAEQGRGRPPAPLEGDQGTGEEGGGGSSPPPS